MNFSKKAEYTCRNCLELSRGRAGPWAFAQICVLLRIMLLGFLAVGQKLSNGASIRYDEQTQVFRIDAADISYVLGVNENKRVQTLYWGRRLSASDTFAKPHSDPRPSSFDSSVNTTRLEFVAWGGGLYVEPELKVTFPDGNRDLVLQYVSHKIDANKLNILLKDISRNVFVELHYQMDATTGALRRSAELRSDTREPLIIEQVASGTWTLPRGEDLSTCQFGAVLCIPIHKLLWQIRDTRSGALVNQA